MGKSFADRSGIDRLFGRSRDGVLGGDIFGVLEPGEVLTGFPVMIDERIAGDAVEPGEEFAAGGIERANRFGGRTSIGL